MWYASDNVWYARAGRRSHVDESKNGQGLDRRGRSYFRGNPGGKPVIAGPVDTAMETLRAKPGQDRSRCQDRLSTRNGEPAGRFGQRPGHPESFAEPGR